jgi:glucose-6-phosphate 1-dehydrogenase
MINEQSRIVVEKPIGYDGVTASKINDEVAQYFPEQAIFRIDHYLGKETVQNLMALRFTNVIFEQLWDAKSIDHVQISISETVGLEGRAGFYDNAGALRDMVQNHALQLLCLVAMESPNKLDAHSIRAEKLKVLEALRPMTGDDVSHNTVRGQYVAGEFDGKLVPGYLEELGKPSSDTETFVAIKAHIDNWRWSKVPFYLRTGKRMKARSAKIVIQFKDVSHRVYDAGVGQMKPNQLIIKLQPGESIQLSLMTKDLSCLETKLKPVSLNLNFSDTYGNFKSDAYKRLILDVAANNPALFIHRDEVDCAWRWIDPIIEQWQQSGITPDLYRAGSWGPSASKKLIEQDGRCWFNGDEAQ